MSTPGGSENAWIWDAVATKAAKTSSLIPISINAKLLLSIQRGVERDCKDSRLTDRTGSLFPLLPKQVNSATVQMTPPPQQQSRTDGLARRGAAQSVGSNERKENDFGGGRWQLGGLHEGGEEPFNRYSHADDPSQNDQFKKAIKDTFFTNSNRMYFI